MNEVRECPNCGGEVWNNVEENNKREAKGEKLRPDYSCKDKENCGWVMWREKGKKKIVVKTTPTPFHSNDDDKIKSMVLSYAKDIVCALIQTGQAPTDSVAEVIGIYKKLMAEIEK